MASRNQTPAPKTSNENSQHVKGQREGLAVDHLESGYDKGISPELKDDGQDVAKTTTQQQEERAKNSNNGRDSLDIPSGLEGEGTKKK